VLQTGMQNASTSSGQALWGSVCETHYTHTNQAQSRTAIGQLGSHKSPHFYIAIRIRVNIYWQCTYVRDK
jgi:hypothetical protein